MDVEGRTTRPRPFVPAARYDAVVVGAGPYGLSVAAHLLGRGLRVAVFGKPMELWREHMPNGMLLRSQWSAANLSDPGRRYTFARFFEESGHDRGYPIPLDVFVEYGLWFQGNAVPEVDATYVASIERSNGGFLLMLEDGRRVEAAAVVMAIGLTHYAYRPPEFEGFPKTLVSHSSEVRELDRFRGRHVMVVGGGQSAVEYSALLYEAGAAVDLVCRRPIVWLEPDRTGQRSLLEKALAPDTGIGPGWRNWILEHAPFLFYRLPQSTKDHALEWYTGAWAADWLRARIAGKVRFHEGHSAVSVGTRDGKLDIGLSDGSRIQADHAILATGYRVDLGRLPMLAPALRASIRAERGVPVLSPGFETSVPGLYFVGATALRAFGPMYRFVLGCRAAAPRVSRSVERRIRGLRGTSPHPDMRATTRGSSGHAGGEDPQ